jgi:sugar phosphate isomerase/epimerase
MFFSGIADEAARSLATQIEAHRELEWSHIELRMVDGVNVTDLSDAAFEAVFESVRAAGLEVSCFASQLANWARPISGDFAVDRAELERAIPRMRRFGTRRVRCMSWPNAKPPWPAEAWRDEAIRRMRILAATAERGGVVLVHENCDGWAGQGPQETLDFLDAVGSPSLKLVFDTGNPTPHEQDGWDFYRRVRDRIDYVHIKDYVRRDGKLAACFAGDGLGRVKETVGDLLAHGYDGGFSIEPHLAAVIHLGKEAADPRKAFRLYVEYGRRFARLFDELRRATPAEGTKRGTHEG